MKMKMRGNKLILDRQNLQTRGRRRGRDTTDSFRHDVSRTLMTCGISFDWAPKRPFRCAAGKSVPASRLDNRLGQIIQSLINSNKPGWHAHPAFHLPFIDRHSLSQAHSFGEITHFPSCVFCFCIAHSSQLFTSFSLLFAHHLCLFIIFRHLLTH